MFDFNFSFLSSETGGGEQPSSPQSAAPNSQEAPGGAAQVVSEAAGEDNAPVIEVEPTVVEEPEIVEEPIELNSETRLRNQVDELAAKLRTVSKAYTDLQDEMDAFRKRQSQLADVKAQRKADEVVERFFEPVENLKRCIESGGDEMEALKKGIEMVIQQFADRMDKLGLREIPGVGATFDPSMHNALAMMPVTNPESDGKILMVHAAGYAVGSRVIQPSQVVIGKFEETPPEA